MADENNSQGGTLLFSFVEKYGLQRLVRLTALARGAYAIDLKDFYKRTQPTKPEICAHCFRAEPYRPAYWLGIDHDARCVVLAIRGTDSRNDVITVLKRKTHEGFGHKGMVKSALWFKENIVETLLKTKQAVPDYDVFVIGHSLGGGVAGLFSYMTREEIPSILCFSFAAPPCVTSKVNEAMKDYVISIFNLDDFVTSLDSHNWKSVFLRRSNSRPKFLEQGSKTLLESSEGQIESETETVTKKIENLPPRRHSLSVASLSQQRSPRKVNSAPKSFFACMSTPETEEILSIPVTDEPQPPKPQNQSKEKQFLPGELYHISRQKKNRSEVEDENTHKYSYSLEQVSHEYFDTRKKQLPRGLLAHRIISYIANLQLLHKQNQIKLTSQ